MSLEPVLRLTGGILLGIGVDLVDVERIREIHQRQGDRFLERIYTKEEREYCFRFKNPYPGLAVRFAAKEAVSKAFGTGIGEFLSWTSIAVEKGERGNPYVVLEESARQFMKKLGGDEILISLTHTYTLAQATAAMIRHESRSSDTHHS